MSNTPLRDYKVQVMNSVDNNLIAIDQLADEIEMAIDNRLDKTYHMSKENLEDLHICLGDDLFHDYLTHLYTITDDKGLAYIKSFSKDHEPKSDKERQTILKGEQISREVLPALEELLHKYTNQYSYPPDFIVMTQKTFNQLERETIDAYGYRADLEIVNTGPQFRGMGIAIIPNRDKHYLQLLVFAQVTMYAGGFKGHIHQGNYQTKPDDIRGKLKPKLNKIYDKIYEQSTISKKNT